MKLYRAFATVGSLTMVSRILGFGRDILIARVLGTGAVADAFVVAFQFPNLFRRLFAEGAFNAAFVPLFTDKLTKSGAEDARSFAEDALAGLLFVLLLLSAAAMAAMPWLMLGIAPGFVDTPEKFNLTVVMTQITFPYLTCMSLVALLSGILNAMGRFTAAAAAPILLNLILIVVMLVAQAFDVTGARDYGIVLAWGVAVAGFAQLVMLSIAAYRSGMGLGFRMPRLTDDMRRLVVLGVPGIVSGGITQINLLVGGIIASFQDGARSFLYYADRLYQLPLGVVGVAIGVVLLPDLVRHLARRDEGAALDSQNRSLEFAALLTVPSSVALAVLAEPLIVVLFQRGAFTAADVWPTAMALAIFAAGLPAFVIQKVFQPGYFARQDTQTPMRLAAINFVINVVVSLGLFVAFMRVGVMPHLGIAIATTLAGWVNAFMLWRGLAARGHFKADARLVRNLPLVMVFSAAMGCALWLLLPYAQPYLDASQSVPVKIAVLAALIAIGSFVFFALAQLLGVVSLGQLRRIVSRQGRSKAPRDGVS
jgi:putative peptidoglycan lipid II flippase